MKMPVVVGLGVDVTHILRFSRLLARPDAARFVRRVLHPTECARLAQLAQSHHPRYVAGCWAAKEALFKTLEPEKQAKFAFRDWRRHTDGGKPVIVGAHNDQFLLSISHDDDVLVATVLRQKLMSLGD